MLATVFLLLWGTLLAGEEKSYSKSPYWWQVRLVIDVTGEYGFHGTNTGYEGKYSFSAVILGTLAEDEDDYIFVQAHQEIKNTRWEETVFNGKTRKISDLSAQVNPDGTLNYVFKNKDILSFDFDFQPVPVPFRNPGPPDSIKKLGLPKSAGDNSVNSKKGYNSRILSGSNRVVLPEKEMYKNQFTNHSFNWTWLKKNGSWRNRHDAGVKLRIVRLKKSSE